MAVKTKDFNVANYNFSEDKTITITKKHTALRIDNMTKAQAESATYKIQDGKLLITSGGYTLTVENYQGIKYIKTDYVKSGKKVTYNLTDLISENLIDNLNTISYNKKGKAYVGTSYNDSFTSTTNAETFTGGLGKNTFTYSKAAGGKDIINLTNKENLVLNLTDINKNEITLKYTNKNKDLMLYIDDDNSITLKNFVAKNVVGTGSITLKTQDNTTGVLLKDEYIKQIITTASNYTGTRLNDYIDATSALEKLNKKGEHVDLVFKGGAGDDTIESSNFADQITGGVGTNTYKYTSLEQLKGDKIYLTKGENAIIDLSALNTTATYNVVGKNLEVTADGNTFTIMNFGTKDVTNNKTKKASDTSSVTLIDSTGSVDLRNTALVTSSSGTWHNDYIDRSDYKLYTDKKKTIVQTNTAKKGLTINGGAGADEIIGTNYSDTIKAGTGTGDSITGGTGNDKLYASTTKGSTTTFNFSAGDGKDTVYSGKGEDTLNFENVSIKNISMSQGKGKNNKDLVIKYSNSDSITIKNYFSVNKKGTITGVNSKNTVKTIESQGLTYNIEDLRTADGDTILTSDGKTVKFGTSEGDTINIASADILIGGDGKDTYEITKYGSGFEDRKHTTVVMGSDGEQDTILFNASDFAGSLGNMKFIKSDNDLVIWYNNDNTLDLEDIGDSGKVHTYSGSEIYKVNDNNAYCSSLTIKDYFTKDQTIDKILVNQYANPSEQTEYSILNDSDSIVGYSNYVDIEYSDFDTVLGSYDEETKIYTGTKYSDHITTVRGTGEGNTVYAGAGNDYIFTWGRTDTVYGEEGDDYIGGNSACQILDGGTGDDEISVKSSSVTNPQGYVRVIGGEGNDTMTGSSYAKQVFEFNVGDGVDTVTSTSNLDVLKFNDVSLDNLNFSQSGNDIIINYGSDDQITLVNAVKNLVTIGIEDKNGNKTSVLTKMGIVVGSGEFSGTENSETIYGSANDDTITSGKGDDFIYAKGGNDILIFNNGDGYDTVYQGANGDVDKLKFADSELSDLEFNIGSDASDLVITYGTNDSVTVKDYFVSGNTVTKWIDKDGVEYDLATVNKHTITETSGNVEGTIFNDYIVLENTTSQVEGKEGANTYEITMDKESSMVTINTDIISTSGRDTIKFTNLDITDLAFGVSGDDATISYSGYGAANLTIKDYLTNMPAINIQCQTGEPVALITKLASAGFIYSDEGTIEGNSEIADRIFGGDSNNTIDGKGGGDIINGGKGNDTFQFKKGYGADTVINGTEENEVDTIQFMDSALDDLDYEVSGNDLIIKYNNGTDSVTVKDYYKSGNTVTKLITKEGAENVTQDMSEIRHVIYADSTDISGTDLNDKIYGTMGDDTIHSSVGNDILIGGDGKDTYEITQYGTGFDDRKHTTIVMGTDAKQDTILFNASDFAGSLDNMKFIKSDNDLVIWYNNDNTLDLESIGDSGKVHTFNGYEIYKVSDSYAYCSSLTIKDYFTKDQTIDKIVINQYANPEVQTKYSILNDSNSIVGYSNHVDIQYSDFDVVLGSYDAETKTYTGTKYADHITMVRGSGEGNTVYAGAGNDYIFTWGRTDTVYGEEGDDYIGGNAACQILDGGAGDDEISVRSSSGNNPHGYVDVYGGTGNDTITAYYGISHIYTNSLTGGKDTTVDTVDTVTVNTSAESHNTTIYAQSKTNTIVNNNTLSNDSYFAYIDQKTSINDKGGNNDSLTLTNTSGETDGNKSNLHVLFNVTSDYVYNSTDSSTLFNGDILITEIATKANYDAWKANGAYAGISVKNNAIETINSSDNYTLTNTDIANLGQSVASWLSNNGYTNVDGVFSNALSKADDNASDIATLIAQFDTANWQNP